MRITSSKRITLFFTVFVLILSYFFQSSLNVQQVEDDLNRLFITPTPSPVPPQDVLPFGIYAVVRVVDGDTIVVNLHEKNVTIRLIGVNTPETVDPRSPIECFGREASNFARDLLNGKNVSLQTDSSQDMYDRYNRLLAYVFLEDGTHVNLRLIEEGYAYEYTYDKPYQYQDSFKKAQERAEKGAKGLWNPAACNGEIR